jgi:RNA polymerase primary sigma factor
VTEQDISGIEDRIKAAMEARGITQSALASEVGASRAAVSAWLSGDRTPSRENITALATALDVPEPWLLYGVGSEPFSRDKEADRAAYSRDLTWHWQRQQPEGKTLGNAAGFAFEVDLRTLTRETAQNSLDELLPGEQTVDLEYTVIELAGADLASFLERLQFDSMRKHLEASAAGRQKAAAAIRAGLEALDSDNRLILIRVADYNANGLTGPEYEDGRFTAVLRDTLNSQKSEFAGGSYGLGKATMWVASSLGLVLANSDLSEPVEGERENRFFGRAELPWHETGGESYAGPGWFGIPDEARERALTRSYFGNSTLAEDLYLDRPDERPGTSLLIVGAYDPSGEIEGIEGIGREIRRAVATSFWPAMVGVNGGPPRLRVTVRTQRGRTDLGQTIVDPAEYVEPLVQTLRRYRDGQVVDRLEDEDDVVVESAALSIPRREGDPEHDAVEQETVVLVAQAPDDPEDESLLNKIVYFRGNQMVIREQRLPGIPFGARPFYAIVMAGEAAGDDAGARHAERFLRAAEPPAHDNWTGTPELTTQYARGARQRIVGDFPNAVHKAIKRQITLPMQYTSDGPDSLKELLRLVPPTSDPPRRPRVKLLEGQPNSDGAWEVAVVVSLPARRTAWEFVPVLKFGTESGAAIPVRWDSLEDLSKCEIVDGKRIRVPAGTRTAEFRGVSDPDSHPVGASRSAVFVDFRAVRPEEVAG